MVCCISDFHFQFVLLSGHKYNISENTVSLLVFIISLFILKSTYNPYYPFYFSIRNTTVRSILRYSGYMNLSQIQFNSGSAHYTSPPYVQSKSGNRSLRSLSAASQLRLPDFMGVPPIDRNKNRPLQASLLRNVPHTTLLLRTFRASPGIARFALSPLLRSSVSRTSWASRP